MRLLINGFPPTPYALAAYVSLLKEEAGPAPWMIATVNVDLRTLFAETIARGGHIRVGLEDTALGTATSNLALVEEAVRIVRDHGPSPPRQPICGRRSAQSPAAPDKLLLRIIACRAARVVQAVGCSGWVAGDQECGPRYYAGRSSTARKHAPQHFDAGIYIAISIAHKTGNSRERRCRTMGRPRNPVPPNTATADRHGIRLTLHHTKAGPAPLGAGTAICFPPRILDAKSPRIGGPDASPRRKPITCHKRNQNRIASESLRMR